MSRKWVVLLVVIAIIAGVLLAVPYFADVNRYRGTIEEKLSRAIGRKVALTELGLSFFPFSLESKEVRISDDPAFREGNFVSVETFRIHVNLRPLLHRQVQVTSLELISPVVRFVKDKRGVWNFSTLGQGNSTAKTQSGAGETGGPGISSFDVSRLTIRNAKVIIIDEARRAEAQTYDIPEFTASNISAASEIPFSLAVLIPGEAEPVRLEGSAGPLDLANLANSPARGAIKAKAYHAGQVMLENVNGEFTIRQGTLVIKPIDFDLYSGKQHGSVVLNFLQPKPVVELDTRMSTIDVNRFLSNTGSTGNLLFGLVDGDVSLRTSGANSEQVLRNLTGKAALELQKGRLAHISIGRQIATVAELAGISFPEGDTPITKMAAHFEMADNWARTQDLQIETPNIALLGQGGFSFGGEMNFDVLATFSQQVSQNLQSRSPLGALLNRVFQNENKQVVVPLQVTGNFQSPRFKLDAQKLLSMRTSQGKSPSKIEDKIRSIQDLFRRKKP